MNTFKQQVVTDTLHVGLEAHAANRPVPLCRSTLY